MEIGKNLSIDFNDFISKVTPIIGKNYFGSMKDLTLCKVCSIEINKPLLYENNNSMEHKENEEYFITKCMTYCDLCCKEIKNDEWREHTISEKPLEFEEKKYCGICNLKYDNHTKYNCTSYNDRERSRIGSKNNIDKNHVSSDLHRKNMERLEFYSSSIFIYIFFSQLLRLLNQ